MQKYLTQLHGDLKAARRPDQFPTADDQVSEEEATTAMLEEAERFAAREIPTKKFGDTCGIQKVQFPPAEKLSEDQLEALCEAIKDLMWSWFVDITLPESLPIERRYHFLINVFDTEVMLVEDGHIGIELCDYDMEHCVFGEYCTCAVEEEEEVPLEIDEAAEHKAMLFFDDVNEQMSLNKNKVPIPFIFQARPVIDSETETLQTLAQWLGIKLENLPDPTKLQSSSVDQITNALLQIWEPDDEMVVILRYLEPHIRLNKLIEFLQSEIWLDSVGCLFFIPIPEKPIPDLLAGMDLDWKKDDEEVDDGEDDDDLELPF